MSHVYHPRSWHTGAGVRNWSMLHSKTLNWNRRSYMALIHAYLNTYVVNEFIEVENRLIKVENENTKYKYTCKHTEYFN